FGVLREVVRASGDHALPEIVFITAYDRFALRAFEVSAVDYLLKPFDDERFFDALRRAKQRHDDSVVAEAARRLLKITDDRRRASGIGTREPRSTPTPTILDSRVPTASYLSRILAKTPHKAELISVESIDWIEAADYYARLHVGARAHLVRETMASL